VLLRRKWHKLCRSYNEVWFLQQVILQFITLDQTAPTLIQWTTVSVVYPEACLPVLCVQNANELKQHLLDVWYGMEQSIIDSAINEWNTSQQAFFALKRKFWINAVITLIITGWTNNITTSVKLEYAKILLYGCSASAIRPSEKCSILIYRKSTTSFRTS